MIEETADKCPFCGATNNAVKQTTDKTPKTNAENTPHKRTQSEPPHKSALSSVRSAQTVSPHFSLQVSDTAA